MCITPFQPYNDGNKHYAIRALSKKIFMSCPCLFGKAKSVF